MEDPCIYLSEMCTRIEEATGQVVSGSTICRVLGRNGFSRKKVQLVATEQSMERRALFRAQVLQFTPDHFVWLDESGSDARHHIRKYGYAVRGIRPVYHRVLARGRRVSALAAISTNGLVGVDLTFGTVNGDDVFADFVRGTVIPEMEPFDGSIKKSIVVMDNCTIHHVRAVKTLLGDAGILLIYLPPYSPDLNPIEETFSYVKYYLKNHDDLLQVVTDRQHHS